MLSSLLNKLLYIHWIGYFSNRLYGTKGMLHWEIILKWILKKRDFMTLTESISLKIGKSGELIAHLNS